jgi:hypothetical protein
MSEGKSAHFKPMLLFHSIRLGGGFDGGGLVRMALNGRVPEED